MGRDNLARREAGFGPSCQGLQAVEPGHVATSPRRLTLDGWAPCHAPTTYHVLRPLPLQCTRTNELPNCLSANGRGWVLAPQVLRGAALLLVLRLRLRPHPVLAALCLWASACLSRGCETLPLEN